MGEAQGREQAKEQKDERPEAALTSFSPHPGLAFDSSSPGGTCHLPPVREPPPSPGAQNSGRRERAVAQIQKPIPKWHQRCPPPLPIMSPQNKYNSLFHLRTSRLSLCCSPRHPQKTQGTDSSTSHLGQKEPPTPTHPPHAPTRWYLQEQGQSPNSQSDLHRLSDRGKWSTDLPSQGGRSGLCRKGQTCATWDVEFCASPPKNTTGRGQAVARLVKCTH